MTKPDTSQNMPDAHNVSCSEEATVWLDPLFRDPNPPYNSDILFEMNQQLNWEEDMSMSRVVLPPLEYKGVFLKGLLWASGMNKVLSTLEKTWPQLKEKFVVIYNSSGRTVPINVEADAVLALYDNPDRERWMRERYPEKGDQIFLPMQSADWSNEWTMCPLKTIKTKDIDILCVSNFNSCKNLPTIAKALKCFHLETGRKLKFLLASSDFRPLHAHGETVYAEFKATLGLQFDDYVDMLPDRVDRREMRALYNRAKITVLGSLSEGKNRSLHESMLCNTPVCCFEAYNKTIRGNSDIFPAGAGEFVPEFSAESLAETWLKMLGKIDQYAPREAYLSGFSGRIQTFNRQLDTLPYYQQNLPDYEIGRHHENPWLSAALEQMHDLPTQMYLWRLVDKKAFSAMNNPEGCQGILGRYLT